MKKANPSSLFLTKYFDPALDLRVQAFNLISFPLAFFTANGYNSGMPAWFTLAFVFTSIMLAGLERTLLIIAEFIIYTACCETMPPAFCGPRNMQTQRKILLRDSPNKKQP